MTKGEGDLLKSREDPRSLPVLIAVCALVHSRRKNIATSHRRRRRLGRNMATPLRWVLPPVFGFQDSVTTGEEEWSRGQSMLPCCERRRQRI
ncbi:hypothetical protein MRB53_023754 [Persea americana]|uniref:Uncharacterized protein n=1 Tax=Persea americana TaxID=3435 RepID=A0ACC2LAA6_PERAE|nr:hypothetical protein MRB53_023754 [Persea americana]